MLLKSEYIFSYKTPLKKLLNTTKIRKKNKLIHNYDNNFINILNDTVIRTNKIVYNTYNFLKLFILHSRKNNIPLPTIDDILIKTIMNIVSIRNNRNGRVANNQNLIKQLQQFYKSEYLPLLSDIPVHNDNLSHVLYYEIQHILTSITNNIKEHFIDHIHKLVNIRFNYYHYSSELKKYHKCSDEYMNCKKILDDISLFKNELLSTSNNITSQYKDLIIELRQKLYNKTTFKKNSVYYDLECNPLDYLSGMIYINEFLEKEKINDPKIKLINILPLRTSIINSYITLDTAALIDLFVKDDNKGKMYTEIKEIQDTIWGKFFRINTRLFNISSKNKSEKERYKFRYIIKTDGVSATLSFSRSKKAGNKTKEPKYIENLSRDELDRLRGKKIITIDPGYDDIIYSLSDRRLTPLEKTNKCLPKHKRNNKLSGLGIQIVKVKEHYENYRYTQAQRNHDTRKRKTNELISQLMEEYNQKKKINIKEIEATIKTNSRTVNYVEFKRYINEKDNANKRLYNFYNKPILKKLNLNRYINTQKSENGIIRNMKKNYGEAKDCVVVLGDYSKKNNLKGKEPTITKKIREILSKSEYETYLIDEYRTSKMCSKCECEMECLKIKSNREMKKLDECVTKVKKDLNCSLSKLSTLNIEKSKRELFKEGERIKKMSIELKMSENEKSLNDNECELSCLNKKEKISLWGVLRCANKECKILQNRDKNACLNMHKIVRSIIKGNGRPDYLKRAATINVAYSSQIKKIY